MATKIEYLSEVKSRQVIWTDWMAEATEGLEDHDMVEVTTERYAWGNFITTIKRARMCAGECEWYRLSSEFSEDPSHEVCDECFARYVAYLDSVSDHR